MKFTDKFKARFFAKTKKRKNGCLEWTGAQVYGHIGLDGKTYRAHRLAYEMENGKIPKGKYVCHACDNPGCVNPEHLWLGTQKENMGDCVAKNRSDVFRGEKSVSSKLTEKDVLEIRKAPSEVSHICLAQKYGVNQTTIGSIRRRVTWKHI